MRQIIIILLLVLLVTMLTGIALAVNKAPESNTELVKLQVADPESAIDKTVEPTRAEKLKAARAKKSKKFSYKRWKRRLPFWPRKTYILVELIIYISLGVLLAQILEVSGLIKYFAILAWPVTKLGNLGQASGPAFIAAFQSGAVANSMLVASTDRGLLNKRQLYSSVFIVSCLSLFAHLPTYVIPIGSVFGMKATAMLFGVRFAAIFFEIIFILLVSKFVVRSWADRKYPAAAIESPSDARASRKRKKGFWETVWSRSRRTLKRLIIFLLPTFVIMVIAEYFGFFKWLSDAVPSLFTLSFLPPQATVIIPAQAMSLYNGAIAAANFLDDGSLTAKQAVLIILIGSLITAPIRTVKHALPTYVAVLGPKAGVVMAVSAQVLRSIFLIIFIVLMWSIWK
ncbi:MAG: nucleoside recognition protein [Planctomycetes bacterium]|nr:nucleoside recognition protein [Planctomycetota bacterium]